MKTGLLLSLALLAFAGNSLLARFALRHALIDPSSFASIRVVSGALLLALLLRRGTRHAVIGPQRIDWTAALSLAVYLVCFALAYVMLEAGSGALILFGAVQLTMIGAGWYRGERFDLRGWIGFAAAVAGLIYLLTPGLTAPPLRSAIAMATAGVAWGVYSLRGRRTMEPLLATANNFALAAVFVLAAQLVLRELQWSTAGVGLAVASGTVTSALGYVAWYAALPRLAAASAAVVQLAVPVLTAFGGVLLLAEPLTLRLAIASIAILGGVAVVIVRRA